MNRHERLVEARNELRDHIECAAQAAGLTRDIRGGMSAEALTQDDLVEVRAQLEYAQAALLKYEQELGA